MGGGRNTVAGAEILGETLRALEHCGRRARAERLDPGRLQAIDQAQRQRSLGSDDDQIDALAPREIDQQVESFGGDGDAFGLGRDAGIAGRAKDLGGERRGGDRPAQSVLAPARSDDENPHGHRLSVKMARLYHGGRES